MGTKSRKKKKINFYFILISGITKFESKDFFKVKRFKLSYMIKKKLTSIFSGLHIALLTFFYYEIMDLKLEFIQQIYPVLNL